MLPIVFAVDPGPTESACVSYELGKGTSRGRVLAKSILENKAVLLLIGALEPDRQLVVEDVKGYGMTVGQEIFDTVKTIARFTQRFEDTHTVNAIELPRRDVKLLLCGSAAAKDSDIRHALIQYFGGEADAIGNKAKPGFLYGFKSHMWAALAVAVAVEIQEQRKRFEQPRAGG